MVPRRHAAAAAFETDGTLARAAWPVCLAWPPLLAVLVGCLAGPPVSDGRRAEVDRGGFANERSAALSAELGALAEALRARVGAPAIGVLLLDSGGLRGSAVAGVRRVGGTDPVELDERWHLGSNAKAMTATLAMKLVEGGSIAAEASVAELLGPVSDDIDAAWRDVTLLDLLGHRGGVRANASLATRRAHDGAPTRRDARADRRAIVAELLRRAPARPAGQAFGYSNLGYVLAATMLETAADRPFESLMEREVFEPLGMVDVVRGAPGGGETAVAVGHRRGLLGRLVAMPPGADNPPFMAPAGTFSLTLADYARFLADQLRGMRGVDGEEPGATGGGAASPLLAPDGYARLRTPPDALEDYALGWGVSGEGRLEHAGSNTMWFALTALAPERDVGVAIVANDGRSGKLAPAFARAIDELIARHARPPAS